MEFGGPAPEAPLPGPRRSLGDQTIKINKHAQFLNFGSVYRLDQVAFLIFGRDIAADSAICTLARNGPNKKKNKMLHVCHCCSVAVVGSASFLGFSGFLAFLGSRPSQVGSQREGPKAHKAQKTQKAQKTHKTHEVRSPARGAQ